MLISLVSVLNLLYFYISTFQSMCAVPNIAVFGSSLTSCFPGTVVVVVVVVVVIIIIIIIIISFLFLQFTKLPSISHWVVTVLATFHFILLYLP